LEPQEADHAKFRHTRGFISGQNGEFPEIVAFQENYGEGAVLADNKNASAQTYPADKPL